jgi:TonB family protein
LKILSSTVFAIGLLFCLSSVAQTPDQKAQTSSGQNAPSPAAVTPTSVDDKLAKEHLIKRVDAPYPPMATAAHVSGVVVLRVEIDTTGAVTKLVVISGPEMLRSAAVNAVKQYSYKPFLIEGVPSTVRTAVQVKFEPFHSKSS